MRKSKKKKLKGPKRNVGAYCHVAQKVLVAQKVHAAQKFPIAQQYPAAQQNFHVSVVEKKSLLTTK